jgi:hypothetical protein
MTGTTRLLRFRSKPILAGDLNAKHPFWNCTVPNPSSKKKKLLRLFNENHFDISAPQLPTYYSLAVNDDVLEIVVHRNIRRSHVSVSYILDSDRLPSVFDILDLV